jgi:hypothetical protein
VRRAAQLRLLLGLALGCGFGCADEQTQSGFAWREFMQFQREVYPVLLRDCGFPACHGASERFFRVWGPGRVRLPREMGLPGAFDQSTLDEQSATHSLSLAMIDSDRPERSLLLRKPLAVEAGGAGHFGVDKYGRDVYRTAQDSGYLALARWVFTKPPAATRGARE